MFSCFGVDFTVDKVFLRSYITDYYIAENMELEYKTYSNDIKAITINPVSKWLCGKGSKDDKKNIYDELCIKNNDMSYNCTFKVRASDAPPYHAYFAERFTSIKIVSDSDFNDKHPAGTDLGDIIIYANSSCKKFIDSGYTEVDSGGNENHYSKKLVSEVMSDDLTLLIARSLGDLYFQTHPTLSQTHHLTVTMTTDDSKVFSASIDIDFGA
jgi:hypothetical protein